MSPPLATYHDARGDQGGDVGRELGIALGRARPKFRLLLVCLTLPLPERDHPLSVVPGPNAVGPPLAFELEVLKSPRLADRELRHDLLLGASVEVPQLLRE